MVDGDAGEMFAGGIFGTTVQPTTLIRALIVFRLVLGGTGVGVIFAFSGPVAGAARVASLLLPRSGRRQTSHSFFFSLPSFSLMNALMSSAMSRSFSHCSW